VLEEYKRRQKKHIIDLISRRSDSTPNFAILIGAGASASSGVRTAFQMVAQWRSQLYDESCVQETFDDWLKKQDWFNRDDEYSVLFERVCDQPAQRRIYVEDCVKDAKPSWGYVYLANMIARGYFNVVFTPNFDDLLNEACTTYAGCKPVVCAHDSNVANVRISSTRPKIIKLHGDFLYDSIKCTKKETDTLEKNMHDKLMQFGKEYGLLIVGYGGHDRSIVDCLETMLREQGYLPNGLYWCIRQNDNIGEGFRRIMQRENAYWVPIEGFDELMAELHEGLGLQLPERLRDPYAATTADLIRFIIPRGSTQHHIIRRENQHHIIQRDILQLEKKIRSLQRTLTVRRRTRRPLVPVLLGHRELERYNYRKAVHHYVRALQQNRDIETRGSLALAYLSLDAKRSLKMARSLIEENPEDYRAYEVAAMASEALGKPDDAVKHWSNALERTQPGSSDWAGYLNGRSNAFLMMGDAPNALRDAEEAIRSMGGHEQAVAARDWSLVLNRCLALKKLGRANEAHETTQGILLRMKGRGASDYYLRAAAYAILDKKKEVFRELRNAIRLDSYNRLRAQVDPDFADYRSDPDFHRLRGNQKRPKQRKS
jgi:tetratricopeptide (TPR) repeat protein/NAD-dependent SIR2 family protein deacetylase